MARFAKPTLITFSLIALVLVSFTEAVQAQDDIPVDPLDRARQASVFLSQTYDLNGEQIFSCVGSGTLLSEDGLILTNARLATPSGPCQGERIIVSLPSRPNDPPVPTYLAEVVEVNTRLDLATLQISSSLSGTPVDQDTLNLPFVTIGDPFPLGPGNTLNIIGYEDAGNSSVSLLPAEITALSGETTAGTTAWFRVDAGLNGTLSGGGAYDSNGALVGIPTSAPAGTGQEPGASCLSVQDTNNDRLITADDACVPVGAEITAVRPVSVALPLIESGRLGFRLESREGLFSSPPSDVPAVNRLFFSTGISGSGLPTNIVRETTTDAPGLFLWFDYRNMQYGMLYEIRATRDGTPVPELSLGPLSWGGGQSGIWYTGAANTDLSAGTYEFTIVVNGETLDSASVQIGDVEERPQFSNLVFGTPDAATGSLGIEGVLLPAEIPQVVAQFDFANMLADQAWTEVWYLDGTEVSRNVRTWTAGADGTSSVAATNVDGLPLGNYRLELFIGEELAATGDVWLAGTRGAQGTSAIFANSRIANERNRNGQPDGQIGNVLPIGAESIYLFFDWDLMPSRTRWTYRWFLDGRLVASRTQEWDAGGVGADYYVGLLSNEALPEGTYAVEVLVENQPKFSETINIGAGTQPLEGEQGETNEIFISGRVQDALTGEGIAGALVFLLNVEFESPQFLFDEAQILTQAITDREGNFSWPRGVPNANFYTLYVYADGYITIIEDNFTIPGTTQGPQDILIEMGQP